MVDDLNVGVVRTTYLGHIVTLMTELGALTNTGLALPIPRESAQIGQAHSNSQANLEDDIHEYA